MSLLSFSDIASLRFLEAEQVLISVESWSDAVRVLRVRGFTRDGLISHNHTTNGDRSIATSSFTISEIPVTIVVYPEAAAVRKGQCYVVLSMQLGGFGVYSLGCGYVSDDLDINWPPAIIKGFTEPPGIIKSVAGTDPAAGAECSDSVPTNARWKVLAARYTLVTSATAADRYLVLVIDDGATILEKIGSNVSHTASLTKTYLFAPGVYSQVDGADYSRSLPSPTTLFQGYRIRTLTSSIQAGDNYGAPQFLVEEWIEE